MPSCASFEPVVQTSCLSLSNFSLECDETLLWFCVVGYDRLVLGCFIFRFFGALRPPDISLLAGIFRSLISPGFVLWVAAILLC